MKFLLFTGKRILIIINISQSNCMKVFIVLALLTISTFAQQCCNDNTISVSGNGEVKVKPDFATITVNVEDTQPTTSAALSNVNSKIDEIISILRRNNIDTKDYSTSSFNIRPQYDFSSGERILTGQTASQGLTVTIRSLDASGSVIGTLVRAFGQINGVQINGVRFDQSDKTLGLKQARKAAYDAAQAKAQEYAKLSGLKLRGVVKIEALNGNNVTPYFTDAQAFRTSPAATTLVPVRDVIVSASVNLLFSLLP